MNRILIRTLFTLVILAFSLGGCGRAATSTGLDPANRIDLAQFPDGLGRGYAAAQVAGNPRPGAGLERGTQAPDFAFLLEDGRHATLQDLKGRPVLINFWATWCGPCRLEMPELVKRAQKDADLVILAVNVQEARTQVEPFAGEFKMNLPIVLDPEGKLRQLYQVRGLPTTYFVGRDGNIASIYAGALTPQALETQLAEIEA